MQWLNVELLDSEVEELPSHQARMPGFINELTLQTSFHQGSTSHLNLLIVLKVHMIFYIK